MNTETTTAYLFHRTNPDFLGMQPVVAGEFAAIGYALLKGDHTAILERFFEATNSANDHAWLSPNHASTFTPYAGVNCEDPMTTPIGQVFVNRARSTSTGDVIVIGNSVYRLGLDQWQLCSDVNALDFIWLIAEPQQMLQAAAHTLADRYQTKLSFGYIGNIEAGRDDRSFMVFYHGPGRTGRSLDDGWGHFEPKNLPLMAERAKTDHNGKGLLENWVAAKATGDSKTGMKYTYGYVPTPRP